VYPFAKRYVSMPQAVLGVAFSFGIPMAFAAVQSSVPPVAWVLVLGNLFWVLAYDTEYAMVDRDDDLLVGMKTSAITLGRADVPVVMLCYGLFLALWAVVLAPRVAAAPLALAWAAAAAQAAWHFFMICDRSRDGCFRAFRLNHWIGVTVVAGVRPEVSEVSSDRAAGQAAPNSSPSSLARRQAACIALMKASGTPSCCIEVMAA
jgi:4-hydroxybenzoate polyprenyltransferase